MTTVISVPPSLDDETFEQVIEQLAPLPAEQRILIDARHTRWASPYGLTAALWTEDVEAAQSLGREIATGTVFMNRCDYLDPALTWTGVKETGRGATLSRVGYEALTRPKSYHLRTRT